MAKKFSLSDYKGDNWDDSEVIDKLPLNEVIAEYRRDGRSEELIYGWCVWRRELEKYNYYKKLMGREWSKEHADKFKWSFEHAVLQDCRENGLMDIWRDRQRLAMPTLTTETNLNDWEDTIDYAYKECGAVEDYMPPLFIPKPDDEEEEIEEISEELPKKEEEPPKKKGKKRGFFRR